MPRQFYVTSSDVSQLLLVRQASGCKPGASSTDKVHLSRKTLREFFPKINTDDSKKTATINLFKTKEDALAFVRFWQREGEEGSLRQVPAYLVEFSDFFEKKLFTKTSLKTNEKTIFFRVVPVADVQHIIEVNCNGQDHDLSRAPTRSCTLV